MHSTINELLAKFRDNRLNASELRTLRRMIDESAPDELEDLLAHEWAGYEPAEAADDPEISLVVQSMKMKIDTALERRRSPWWKRAAAIAAAVMLPLFMLSTFYFYSTGNRSDNSAVLFESSSAHTFDLTLPDASKVTLGFNSRINYDPETFLSDSRRITFAGEGYFNIHSDAAHPFIIDAGDFEVIVTGTSFNLYCGGDDMPAELALESGNVEIISAGRSTHIRPSQRARIHRASGQVTVEDCPDVERVTAWTRGEIILRDASAGEVADAVRRFYGVNVIFDSEVLDNNSSTFTGTLPMASIQDALNIIQLTFDTEVSVRP